ncbi:putative N-acetyltransferase YhbS [Methylopila capsulata]|uniref:GCN5 family N-acetyltransferase n=1 Tax=Methylopila capsulata TaxID=61654 RepID=A0A9W6IX35_9HYPH|nr:N-acetyltransferase [Methylopila capsulata]MBM7852651.1 putative N-acetyltransferase YhbS [Methylopila capsulata]GLK56859.1 GCN5 family N-acetyltransferase [Methylopila capsulata]
MAVIRDEAPADAGAREALLDRAFGSARFAKTCERLRAGRLAARGLALKAEIDGRLVGTLRFWHVAAGDRAALMLGPLAVEADVREGGVGAALMHEGLARAAALGHQAVILVGDAPYYARFGFDAGSVGGLAMPGPVERARFLGLELIPGALAGAAGLVRATGAVALPTREIPAAAPKRAA